MSLDATLTRCPKCGFKRFDPLAGACERRQCGYEVDYDEGTADGTETGKYVAELVRKRMAERSLLNVRSEAEK